MTRVDWEPTLERAAEIVNSYAGQVTLRQLFYRLVSDGTLPNTRSYYQSLSRYSAEARRAGWFPSLTDRTRSIRRAEHFDNPEDSIADMVSSYRRNRTAGQEWAVYIAVEKDALSQLLSNWYGETGIPIVVTSGYASQSYIDAIRSHVRDDGRRAVLLYGGDFDPSGEDIERDLQDRTGWTFDEIRRVAVLPEHIDRYDLPPQPGKSSDTRAGAFIAEHGRLIQVELDAIPPGDLHDLYDEALDDYWDWDTYDAVREREDQERQLLIRLEAQFSDLADDGSTE